LAEEPIFRWRIKTSPVHASGGDELNLIEKGENYGWPLVGEAPNYNCVPFPILTRGPTWRRRSCSGTTV